MFTGEPIFALPLFYLDPGSGSFIVQLLLGAGLGLIVGAKLYWAKVKRFFSHKHNQSTQTSDETDVTER